MAARNHTVNLQLPWTAGSDYVTLYRSPSNSFPTLPDQVLLLFKTTVCVRSSSDSTANDLLLAYSTEEMFSVPCDEIFSDECKNTMRKLIRIVVPGFSLQKKLKVRVLKPAGEITKKSVENSDDLTAEIASFFQEIKNEGERLHDQSPKKNYVVFLGINKVINVRDHYFRVWKAFSESSKPKYHYLVRMLPMLDLYKRMAMFNSLEKLSVVVDASRIDCTELMETCSICWQELSEDGGGGDGGCSEVVRLGCRHPYHRDCIGNWFKINQSCPYCRASYVEMIEQEEDDLISKSASAHTYVVFSSRKDIASENPKGFSIALWCNRDTLVEDVCSLHIGGKE